MEFTWWFILGLFGIPALYYYTVNRETYSRYADHLNVLSTQPEKEDGPDITEIEEKLRSNLYKNKVHALICGVVLTALWAGIGNVALAETRITPPPSNDYQQAALKLGLESGKSYPLDIGTRGGSPGGTLTVSRGAFTATGKVNFRTGSTIPLSFDGYNDKGEETNWEIEVPTALVSFRIDNSLDRPQMSLVLSSDSTPYGEVPVITRYECDEVGDRKIVNFLVTYTCAGEWTPILTEHLTLPTVVSNSLKGVSLTLTQAQKDSLMGKVE